MQETKTPIYEEKKVPIREWCNHFHKGEVLDVKGLKMKIVDIKQLRGQLTLDIQVGEKDGNNTN